MSQENVEAAREMWEAFNRRDLDDFLAFADPEAEFVSLLSPVEGGAYHGHDGIRRLWKNLADVFPDATAQIVEVRDLGDEMLGAVRFIAHGAESDVPLDWTVWYAVKWRRGKFVSVAGFEGRAAALEAVGLSE